uniref:Uncharacterized protein n=1 Tax=viral metagenome TaxID=1070528 RepID=A0A6H1ZSB3_9ZZZZ
MKKEFRILLLELDSKTGLYVAMNNKHIMFQSPSNEEVFEWASKRADILILGKYFKVPYIRRRRN